MRRRFCPSTMFGIRHLLRVNADMRDMRLGRVLLVAAVLLTLGFVVAPYARHYFFAATTPRAVQPRADLTELEKTTIALFEQTSPAVVQVVVQREGVSGMGE